MFILGQQIRVKSSKGLFAYVDDFRMASLWSCDDLFGSAAGGDFGKPSRSHWIHVWYVFLRLPQTSTKWWVNIPVPWILWGLLGWIVAGMQKARKNECSPANGFIQLNRTTWEFILEKQGRVHQCVLTRPRFQTMKGWSQELVTSIIMIMNLYESQVLNKKWTDSKQKHGCLRQILKRCLGRSLGCFHRASCLLPVTISDSRGWFVTRPLWPLQKRLCWRIWILWRRRLSKNKKSERWKPA